MILSGININIVSEKYCPTPTLWTCPKVTHRYYTMPPCYLWITAWEGGWFQNKVRNISGLYSLIHLLRPFLFFCVHVCACAWIYLSSPILFLKISIIVISHNTPPLYLLRVNKCFVNQLTPPLDHFGMYSCDLKEILSFEICSRAQKN